MNYQGFKIKSNRNILVNLESVIVYVVVICEQTLCGKPSSFADQRSCHCVDSANNSVKNIDSRTNIDSSSDNNNNSKNSDSINISNTNSSNLQSTFTDQQSCHYVNSSIISNKIYIIPRKF